MVSPAPQRMRVLKYIPDKMFGFVVHPETGRQAFFHLGVFRPGATSEGIRCKACPPEGCDWAETPPSPILGEEVLVTVDWDASDADKAPRATQVARVQPPVGLTGIVESFDSLRGFGFVVGSDACAYHLHSSEIVDNRIPVVGNTVVFYAGTRQDRPRACHVKVCP